MEFLSQEQIEANHFAAELLIPEAMIRKDVETEKEIKKLADMYEVDVIFMKYRLVQLHIM